MGKQFVDFNTKLMVIDCYLPILPAMQVMTNIVMIIPIVCISWFWFQYLAYLSWLKLGEVSVNPFGEDDDDFDIIGLFDNHVKVTTQSIFFWTKNLKFIIQFLCREHMIFYNYSKWVSIIRPRRAWNWLKLHWYLWVKCNIWHL